MARHKQGYLLAESIVALLISILILSLGLACLKVVLPKKQSLRFQHILLEQTFIFLQQELNIGINEEIENNNLCYVKNNQKYCFIVHNNRLVKTPGYDVYLLNVDSYEVSLLESSVIFKINAFGREYVKELLR